MFEIKQILNKSLVVTIITPILPNSKKVTLPPVLLKNVHHVIRFKLQNFLLFLSFFIFTFTPLPICLQNSELLSTQVLSTQIQNISQLFTVFPPTPKQITTLQRDIPST